MIIQGRKYNFEIVSQKYGTDFSFFIRAKNKSTNKISCINNLNVILSEFVIEMDDPRVADSTWKVREEEAHHLVVTARKFLLTSASLDYIERQLDEDRILGEWENKKITKPDDKR